MFSPLSLLLHTPSLTWPSPPPISHNPQKVPFQPTHSAAQPQVCLVPFPVHSVGRYGAASLKFRLMVAQLYEHTQSMVQFLGKMFKVHWHKHFKTVSFLAGEFDLNFKTAKT